MAIFIDINQAYFMGLLFLISGYFSPQSLDRKGPARFVRDRLIRLGIPLVVAVFDADRLQLVNETFTHDVGDRALQELGRLLETALAAPSFVARLGGDKFLAVLPGLDLSAAAEVLESIRAAVEGHAWERIVGDLRLTVSVGAAMAYATDTPTALLARSDRNLYAAKKAGRNRVATGTR